MNVPDALAMLLMLTPCCLINFAEAFAKPADGRPYNSSLYS